MRSMVAAAMLMTSLTLSAAEVVPFSATQRTALGIEVAPVTTTDAGMSARLPAQVAVPNAQLQVIAAPLDGMVETLLTGEGEQVTAGQSLARMQSPHMLELQSEYLETRARFELAQSIYRRDQQLYNEGIIAERRLLESKANHQELATTLARVRHLLELAGMDDAALNALRADGKLSGSVIVRAPFGGVILKQMVGVGERVAISDPLYQLAQLKPLWLEIHAPLEQAAALQTGQRVQVPDLGLSGTIVAIGRQVHGVDQGVLIRAEIREGAERLRPGQFVQAQLETGAGASLRVPRSAVFRSDAKSYVFVEQLEGFRSVEVQVLHEEPAHLIVLGINPGDLAAGNQVAVAGVAALKAAWLGGRE